MHSYGIMLLSQILALALGIAGIIQPASMRCWLFFALNYASGFVNCKAYVDAETIKAPESCWASPAKSSNEEWRQYWGGELQP